MTMNTIKDIVLAVTYQCNGRCRFCNIWTNQDSFSCKFNDYKRLPRNIENVNISGGEPFLREDLPEVVRTVKNQCPKAKIIISTNGFTPCKIKEQMQKIIKFKRDIGIAVSLDGFGKTHEELRGFPGGFSLALESIRLLKELGIKNIKIAFTLGNQNINQLKRIYQLSNELGVEFSLAAYHNSSHYFKKEDNKIIDIMNLKKEINWLIRQELKSFSLKKWARAYFAFGLFNFLRDKKRILPDYSGINSLFIDPFGNIYPSDVWNLKLGNLKKINDWSDFSEIIKIKILSNKKPESWMICTAREAMKKHSTKVALWIVWKKFLALKKERNLLNQDKAINNKCKNNLFSFGNLRKFF